jgi:hypothetical protein
MDARDDMQRKEAEGALIGCSACAARVMSHIAEGEQNPMWPSDRTLSAVVSPIQPVVLPIEPGRTERALPDRGPVFTRPKNAPASQEGRKRPSAA